MAESTLGIAYSELISEIGYVFGYGRTEGNWSTTQNANVQQALKRGLRMFYVHPPIPGSKSSHEWRFLRPVTTIKCWPSYAVSASRTVTTSGTGVTATGDTVFYDSMVGKTITINSVDYTIASVTSSTVLVLTASVGGAAGSGLTWAMTSDGIYQLPDGFGGLIGKPTFGDTTTTFGGPLPIVGEFDIRDRQQHNDTTGRPERVAVRSQTTQSTSSVGTRWQLMTDPVPDAVYTLRYQYRILPDLITSSYAYHLGGAAHAQTILSACLAATELIRFDQPGPLYEEFLRQLTASIEHDNGLNGQESFGYNGDGSTDDGFMRRNTYYVTYNGTQY